MKFESLEERSVKTTPTVSLGWKCQHITEKTKLSTFCVGHEGELKMEQHAGAEVWYESFFTFLEKGLSGTNTVSALWEIIFVEAKI